MKRADLAGAVQAVVDDLTNRGYPHVGVLRQAARVLLGVDRLDDEDGCPRCGAPVEQPTTGRRRRYCSTRCRQGAWRDATAT